MQPLLDQTNERGAMQDGKDDVEVVKVTIYEVEHELHFWKLEGWRRGWDQG